MREEMDPPKNLLDGPEPLTTIGDQHQKTPTKGLEDHKTGCASPAGRTMTMLLFLTEMVKKLGQHSFLVL